MTTATATPDSGFNFKNTKLAKIPLNKIRENAEALRVTVNKEDPNYLMNLDSVRKRGIMNPILVREIEDPVSKQTLYGLIDGLHRLNWAMDAGLTEIPANIGSLAEADLLEAQIIANVARIETKPVQYTKALIKILGSNPLLTEAELASRLSRDTQWIKDRLGLMKLNDDIKPLVDDGTLGLVNAYALSKLPEDKQRELVNQALSQPATQFCPMAEGIRKEIAKAKREGRAAEADVFRPQPRLQKLASIKDQQAFAATSPANSEVIKAARAAGCTTMEQGVAFALSWILHLDPASVAADRVQWEADREADKAEKARKEAEKLAKKNAGGPAAGPAGPLVDPFAKQAEVDAKSKPTEANGQPAATPTPAVA
jgi:ParB family chromosome partitioning protein